MKLIWSWLSDPFFHIALVILLMIKLAASWSAEPETQAAAGRSKSCMVCRTWHQVGLSCPEQPARWPSVEALARSNR